MVARKPHFVDRYVGERVQARREALGMSQGKLADALGISFQQVQKYEKGTNRMGASRLYEISLKLEAPLTYFYDGLKLHSSDMLGFSEEQAPFAAGVLETEQGREVLDAFLRIESAEARDRILDLVKTLASNRPKPRRGRPPKRLKHQLPQSPPPK